MALITIEDNKYYCDFCGKTKILSEIQKEGTDKYTSHKIGMYTVTVNELIASKLISGVIGYKNGVRAGKESFEASERKYKKYVVCEDCLKELERLRYNTPNYESDQISIEGKETKSEINLREWSVPICGLMENLLDFKNITIPNDDRVGDEGEARIYGSDYFDLEDGVVQLLNDLVKEVKKNPNRPINTDTI